MSAKDKFFRRLKWFGIAVTFDDLRLRTGYSEVMPEEVSITSRFSRNVPLQIPIVSSPMDTVTESELAKAMALCGGLGIIHHNLSPKKQAEEAARVKFFLNGLIPKPVTVRETDSVASILQLREEKKYSFHSFLVLDETGRLSGVLTKNDFDFCRDTSLPASQVMTRDVITSGPRTTLDEAYRLMQQSHRKLLPIVDEHRHVVGLYTFADVKRIKSNSSARHTVDARGQLRVGAAIGTGQEALERVALLTAQNVDVVVIDTAHADKKPVYETIRDIRLQFPGVELVAGNVSEAESAERLAKAGVDGIKVGQGPGSICTTRIIAGVGCPQVTAVYECAKIADAYGIPVCADGGLTNSGDIAVAIGAGASSVMMGTMLAGTKEAPGEPFFLEGQEWKIYRGMGSLGAMLEGEGARQRYNQAKGDGQQLVPEGIEGRVLYKGELARVLHQYEGGLRKGMGYVGAATIEELRAKATFWWITTQGQIESHPHGVRITREPPNYRRSYS